ncbi:MAG: response regulator [Candidatus Aureabacteria bacterium]|nr:response regulator [Candidatus Auribacterota bacterium]
MDKKLVLVIDDQEDLRFILKFDLQKNGYEVIQAGSGEEGIEKARTSRPDIILLDRKMPGIDGVETCRKLKRDDLTKDIPVLMISGRSLVEELKEALQVGAAGYIVKPFKFEDVISKISEVLNPA